MQRRGQEKVEVDLARATWRKSVRSGGAQDCVEIADNLSGVVGVRDSKDPESSALAFTRGEWSTFVGQVKNGTFDCR